MITHTHKRMRWCLWTMHTNLSWFTCYAAGGMVTCCYPGIGNGLPFNQVAIGNNHHVWLTSNGYPLAINLPSLAFKVAVSSLCDMILLAYEEYWNEPLHNGKWRCEHSTYYAGMAAFIWTRETLILIGNKVTIFQSWCIQTLSLSSWSQWRRHCVTWSPSPQ